MPVYQETSVQTENEDVFLKRVISKESEKKEQSPENFFILEEMNPGLSFSSCPMSELKTHPSKENLHEFKMYKDIFSDSNRFLFLC